MGGALSPWGYRANLAVTDWNGDGKKDLLVGDYSSSVGPAPDLTPEQAKAREKLVELLNEYMREDPKYGDYQQFQDRMREIWQELKPLEPKRESHGFVWLLLRN